MFFLFFLSVALVLPHPFSAQEAVAKDQAARFESLFKEMDAAIQSGGWGGLEAWARANKDRIENGFILYVSGLATSLKSDGLLRTAQVLALEKGDIKVQADILLCSGEYWEERQRYDDALVFYQTAGLHYAKIGDQPGQGQASVKEGDLHLLRRDRTKALAAFDKALPFLEKAGDDFGMGYIYKSKGEIFRLSGKYAEALAMYGKALPFFEKVRSPLGQGSVFHHQGDVQREMGRKAEALALYGKALPYYERAQYPYGQGSVLFAEGEIFFDGQEFARALALYEKALAFFSEAKDADGQGNAYLRQGNVRADMGERDVALAMYEKALSFYLEAKESQGQGNVCLGKAEVHLLMSDNVKALEMYEKARVFFEKTGDFRGQANAATGMGDVYALTGQKAKALEMYEKALPLFEKLQSFSGQGHCYRGLGYLHLQAGENSQALKMYEKALRFYEKAGDSTGLGYAYKGEGDVHFFSGENAKALEMYEKALPLFEKLGDPLGRANVYKAEGNVYMSAGAFAKAVEMFEKALPLYDKLRDPLGQGNIYRSAGDLYMTIRDFPKALPMYERALSAFERAQDPLGQGSVLERIGEIHFQRNENGKALEMFEKSLSLFERLQDPLGLGDVNRYKGAIHSRIGEPVQALAAYDKAISCYDRAGADESLAFALTGKAGVLAGQGEKAEALKCHEEGLRRLEKVRVLTGVPELKKAYLQKVLTIYDQAARFMLDNGYPERSFRVVEAMKARLFLDLLAESRAGLDGDLDPALKERRDALMGRMSALAKAVSQANDEARGQSLKSERDRVQAEFEKLQVEIRLKNPAYAAVRYPEPAGLDILQKKVLRPGETLVEYFLSEERAFAFVVTASAFKALELPSGTKAIRAAAVEYLARIGDPAFKTEDEQGLNAAGAAVYELVLKPVEADLPEGGTLVLVPDGVLARMPFEGLIVSVDPAAKRPIYLLEKRPVKYIQSASVLAFLRSQSRPAGLSDAFIGFGDPVYDYEGFLKKAAESGDGPGIKGEAIAELNKSRFAAEGVRLNRLEGSGREVKEIADLFRTRGKAGQRAESKLRLDASEENAKAPAMADYGYILFSCHGLLGAGFQSLVLSQIPGSKEDGFLTLGEMMNCRFRARLVVLSACETGRGTEERGEGVTGLTRAVMYAGSPAAVVSLWSVSDAATRKLMVNFFRRMIEERLSKDEALRRAKLDILKEETALRISYAVSVPIRHPFFWAAFVMYGE